MPASRSLQGNAPNPPNIIAYVVTAAAIILGVYYLPNYLFLEISTANHAASLLSVVGIDVQSACTGTAAFLDDIRIVKECTGIQVISVFLGLIIPLPNAGWTRKLLTISIVSAALYVANVVRIALEFSLVHFGILPWSLAHYPMSLLLGVIGVVVLAVIADEVLPEFGAFLLSAIRRRPQ